MNRLMRYLVPIAFFTIGGCFLPPEIRSIEFRKPMPREVILGEGSYMNSREEPGDECYDVIEDCRDYVVCR